MKDIGRTSLGSRFRAFKQLFLFIKKNPILMLFVTLFVSGLIIGCMCYSNIDSKHIDILQGILLHQETPKTMVEGYRAVVSSLIYPCSLLIILFLLGLTPFGCPVIITIPFIFGIGVGIVECNLYRMNGWLFLLTDFAAHIVITVSSIVIACIQALCFSYIFSRQLLPYGAHCGGMWQDFKLYLLRFLFCIFLCFLAATIRVVLQVV